jgi:Spy/CpxP family protein refolding chaperone
MKKLSVLSLGLVFLSISFLTWGTPAVQADECTANLFWTLMEGVNLTPDQFVALVDYVSRTNLGQAQDDLRARLKATREAIKAELLKDNPDAALIEAKAHEVADILNQLIANRVYFLAFLQSLLTSDQMDTFRGNALDMALERSKKGNILLRLIKIVRSLGLDLSVRSQLGDDFLRFLRDEVVPRRANMAHAGLSLRLAVREDPTNTSAIKNYLDTMASIRTEIVVNRINFTLHTRNLIGPDKMAAFFEQLEAEFTPICQEE